MSFITNKGIAVSLGTYLDLMIPDRPLAQDALEIVVKQESKDFIHWTEEDHRESFQLINKVAEIWKKNNIDSFLVIGIRTENNDFRWQIVPYPNQGSPIFQQLSVLWRLIFGTPILADKVKEDGAKRYEIMCKTQIPSTSLSANNMVCHFCSKERKEKQEVFNNAKGKASLWYDSSPLAYKHFLAIPHQHLATIADMDERIYLTWMEMAKNLITLKPKEINASKTNDKLTIYLYWKNGKRAGQSVPHMHIHIVMIKTIFDMIIGYLISFTKTVLCFLSLSSKELEKRVSLFKKELAV